MRVFVAVPLEDRTADEVREKIAKAIDAIKVIFCNEPELRIIYKTNVSPLVQPDGLLHLGNSIADMDSCDAVYFCPGWEQSKKCLVKHRVCELYNIQRIEA